jgi:hypothetical protein
VARMRVHERIDRLLYRFATVLYAQRVRHVPREVLALSRPGQSASSGASQSTSQSTSQVSTPAGDVATHLPPSCSAQNEKSTRPSDSAGRSASMPIPEDDAIATAQP